MREEVIERVSREKIIAIVRGVGSEQCMKVAQALYDGGIRLMEVTYDQSRPESWDATAKAIGDIVRAFEGKMLAGAGTVTEPALVDLTREAGGLFIISPDTNIDVIKRTRELGLVSMPGALTPSEIMTAHRAGADFVKTSTGKVPVNATPEAVYVMSDALRQYHERTGRMVGIKVAGGVTKVQTAVRYFTIVRRVLGEAWSSPRYFRIGASHLLDDVLKEMKK